MRPFAHLLLLSTLVASLDGFAESQPFEGKSYQLPMTALEAPLMFPALAATAQDMGFKVVADTETTKVWLADGSYLRWHTAKSGMMLNVWPNCAGLAPAQVDDKFREVKAQADHLWQTAVETRQKNNIGAVVLPKEQAPAPPRVVLQTPVVVQGAPGSRQDDWSNDGQQSESFAASRNRSARASAPVRVVPAPAVTVVGRTCRSSLDCDSGEWCREWGGQHLCLGNSQSGVGQPCLSSLDCGSGLFCHGASGMQTCR